MRFFNIDDISIDFKAIPSSVKIEEGVFMYDFTNLHTEEKWTVYTNDTTVHKEDGPAIIIEDLKNGKGIIREYWIKNGKLHRYGGPALYKVFKNGHTRKAYFVNGLPNNDEGPAVLDSETDYVAYMINGKYESINGIPSVSHKSKGSTTHMWHKDGKLHRVDGPAHVYGDYPENKRWYLNGICVDTQYKSFLKKEKKKESNEAFREFSAWFFFNKLLK